MSDKPDFWQVWLFPWARKNPYRLGLHVLILIYAVSLVTWLAIYLRSGKFPAISIWWLIWPVALAASFTFVFLMVGRLVRRTGRKLPPPTLLRSNCIVVHGNWETAGLVQLTHDRLLIQPLVGKLISIPLDHISDITEHRWYNGHPYYGKTLFLELEVPETISNKRRLGFGVEDADRWKKLLLAANNIT
jgi:hypothetical protein